MIYSKKPMLLLSLFLLISVSLGHLALSCGGGGQTTPQIGGYYYPGRYYERNSYHSRQGDGNKISPASSPI